MPTLVFEDLTESLHETNGRLSSYLNALAGLNAGSLSDPRPASPQQMAGLLSELMRIGPCLRALPSRRDAGLERELADYRKNVERLRELLPSIHGALLRERARLEQERSQVELAVKWAHGSSQTL